MKSYKQRQISRGINLYKLMVCGIKNDREQRILKRIQSIQKKTKKVIVKRPKKGLSK